MKKRILFILVLVCILALSAALLCACNDTDTPTPPNPDNGDNNNQNNPANTLKAYVKVSGGEAQLMQASQENGVQSFTITLTLQAGDTVDIFDSSNVTYTTYNVSFDGVAKIGGEYVFTLKIAGSSNVIYVEIPQQTTPNPDPDPTPTPTPDPNPTPDPAPTPQSTKVTVFYTNSERWTNVYAYVWNYKSGASRVAWPGQKLQSCGTSNFGETQYSVEVDFSQYDRIIFNNGAGAQTKDLIVGSAASGYYGKDGVFTMNTENYGKVEYFTLKDAKNLQYIANCNKKISVYTPSGYNANKKYGVLYMFDSQNLYAAATGAQPSSDSYGSWAVDVAVTSLVKNGRDGVIIVAIDNTDGHRDSELTMSQSFGTLTNLADNSDFYNGKLDELGNFLKDTVIPFVQSRYSVDTSRDKTGIAGSSSGGLAAYYLGLRDNDIYGYIGAFSPANGLFKSDSWTRFYASKNFSAGRPKIYAYCGVHDNNLEDMLLPATKEIIKLTSYGFSAADITENYVENGTHSENYWRIAFVDFLSKMLG